jgi:hypothetical protein
MINCDTQHKRHSITTLWIKCQCDECCVSFIVMLNAIILRVVVLNVDMLSALAPTCWIAHAQALIKCRKNLSFELKK